MTTNQDLTTATPVEIDTALAALYREAAHLSLTLRLAVDSLHTYTGSTYKRTRSGRSYDRSTEEALAAADSGEGVQPYYLRQASEAATEVRETREAITANRMAQTPLREEFTRRGGWTRAFVVLTSGNGHVHKSMDCHTCYPTTQFAWMPAYSGKDEAEIIEAAGSDACTICYPHAPVTTRQRARSMWTPEEIDREKAREERAAAAAERAAKKATKTITDVDGSPLQVLNYISANGTPRYSTLATAAAAKSWLTDAHEGWRTPPRQAYIDRVADALAAINGTSRDAEIEAAKKRAAKRR